MPTDVIVQLLDLMDDIDSDPVNPYERLKEFLVAAYVPSKWARARRLLRHPPLGDQKPSALMAQMLALQPPGEHVSTLFLTLFLDRLPQNIRDNLASFNFATARDMAAHADRLWDQRPPDAAALAALSLEHRRSPSPVMRSHSRDRGTKRAGSPYPNRNNNNNKLCFYHQTFGANAHNCSAPCSWSGPSPPKQTCFYHTRFGSNAQKCEQPCSWPHRQQGNASPAGGTSTN